MSRPDVTIYISIRIRIQILPYSIYGSGQNIPNPTGTASPWFQGKMWFQTLHFTFFRGSNYSETGLFSPQEVIQHTRLPTNLRTKKKKNKDEKRMLPEQIHKVHCLYGRPMDKYTICTPYNMCEMYIINVIPRQCMWTSLNIFWHLGLFRYILFL